MADIKTISQLAGNPRFNISGIFKNPVDGLLAGYFLESLPKKTIEKLAETGIPKLIALDYFSGQCQGDVSPQFLTECFLSRKHKSSKGEFYIQTPERCLVSEAYLSIIKNEPSKKLLDNAESKPDLKRVVYFDVIYSELDDKRKNSISVLGSVSHVAIDAAMYHKGMSLENRLAPLSNEIAAFLDSIPDSDLSTRHVKIFELEKRFEEFKECEDIQDPCLIAVYRDSLRLLEQAKSSVKEKAKQMAQKQYPEFRDIFSQIDSKQLIDSNDMKKVKDIYTKAKNLSEMLKLLDLRELEEDLLVGKIEDIVKCADKITKEFKEFESYKSNFESSAGFLLRSVSHLSRKRFYSFFGRIKTETIYSILNSERDLNNLMSRAETYKGNRYFSVFIEDPKARWCLEESEKLLSSLRGEANKALRGEIEKETFFPKKKYKRKLNDFLEKMS